jgi:G:T-mismatch repair DNA endonuclease (very short patch repair protein)
LDEEESKIMDEMQRVTVHNEKFKLYEVEVDAICAATSTAYMFHSCFYKGCTSCYNAYSKTPHRYTVYEKAGQQKERAIRFGELYAVTCRDVQKLKDRNWNVIEQWECSWTRDVERAHAERHEQYKSLIPREAYFGGRVNAVKLYYRCEGVEKLHYMDVTSMYPAVMSLPQYRYPIGAPTILKKERDDVFVPLEDLFGLMKCSVIPPTDLYHPILPRRFPSGKVLFDLTPCVGTWTHIELQRAVAQGYVITEIFEQHHFPRTSNDLFREYNETFFAIKRQAKLDGNKGLETIAKMCINSPTGKWGFNPSKQKRNELVTDGDTFFRYLCGDYEHLTMALVNNDVCLATIQENDTMTEHDKSNVYISAYITAYARCKLIDDVFVPLNEKVLYYDTDSVIYVSPTGEYLVPCNTQGELGTWASELPSDDWFVEFASSGPKTYSCRSASGTRNVNKSKGFHLHWENTTIFHMESLKEALVQKAQQQPFEKMRLHAHETIMRRTNFHVEVENNKGKVLNMTYDKRYICPPCFDETGQLKSIDTLPWGHVANPEEL